MGLDLEVKPKAYRMTVNRYLKPADKLPLARRFLKGKAAGSSLLLQSVGSTELFFKNSSQSGAGVKVSTIGQWVRYFNMTETKAKALLMWESISNKNGVKCLSP